MPGSRRHGSFSGALGRRRSPRPSVASGRRHRERTRHARICSPPASPPSSRLAGAPRRRVPPLPPPSCHPAPGAGRGRSPEPRPLTTSPASAQLPRAQAHLKSARSPQLSSALAQQPSQPAPEAQPPLPAPARGQAPLPSRVGRRIARPAAAQVQPASLAPWAASPTRQIWPKSSESIRSVRIRSATLARLLHGFVLLPSGISAAGTGNAMN